MAGGFWRLGELDFCAFSCFLSGKLKIVVPLKALSAARLALVHGLPGHPRRWLDCYSLLLEWVEPDTSSYTSPPRPPLPSPHPLPLLMAFWGMCPLGKRVTLTAVSTAQELYIGTMWNNSLECGQSVLHLLLPGQSPESSPSYQGEEVSNHRKLSQMKEL